MPDDGVNVAERRLAALIDIRRRKRLLTFIPTITPKFKAPVHLAPMIEKIELSRLMPVLELVSTPPRHGKTETLLHAAAWLLRQDPAMTIAYATHSGELAKSKSRRAKRFALAAGVQLAPGSKSVAEWRTTAGGGFIATSVGGSFTGRGFDFGIIDDAVKDREEAESELQREKVWEWFNNVAFTRAEPGASIVVNMCMVGSTLVLMADGTQKELRDIRPGDVVATYDNGQLTTAVVQNWKNQGIDSVFKIKTSSGTSVIANERHPFLVLRDGGLKWLRLREIRVGDQVVRVTGERQSPCCSRPLNTYGFTLDVVESLEPAGYEDVFDVQIARTENFIANGLVSHNTRWHEDDLIGRLQRSELPWHTTVLPALGGENEDVPLWPSRYSLEQLRKIKQQVGDYTWQSLYQGSPTNKAGSVFKRKWFKDNLTTLVPRSFDYKLITVDGAWSTGVGADYSCVQVWGVSRIFNSYYLLDVQKHRLEFPDLLRLVVAKWQEHPQALIAIENSSSGIAVYQTLKRETSLPVIAVSVHTKKETRAEEISPIIESGRCKFPIDAPWVNNYIDEMCSFPNGTHDDQVDATSLALKRIVEVENGRNVDVFLERSQMQNALEAPAIYQR
jgi:predicted phage terminase large subunit-like protein